MKSYTITINGKVYAVTVEDGITGGVVQAAAPVAPAPAAAAPAAPAPAPAAPVAEAAPAPAAPAAPAEGTQIVAPMPGTILDVKVSAGASVGQNEVIIVLEAMKMENDIVTPVAGTVASINVNKGDTVNAGDVLAVIA